MIRKSSLGPFSRWRLRAALALLASCSAWAAGGRLGDAEARYQQERAHCLSGQSHQDRATCLKEARNAYAEARRGRLDNGQQMAYHRNALKRCDALPAEDRADCADRVEGRGLASGSVHGGGIYRETTTVQIGTPGATSTSGTSGSTPAASAPAQ